MLRRLAVNRAAGWAVGACLLAVLLGVPLVAGSEPASPGPADGNDVCVRRVAGQALGRPGSDADRILGVVLSGLKGGGTEARISYRLEAADPHNGLLMDGMRLAYLMFGADGCADIQGTTLQAFTRPRKAVAPELVGEIALERAVAAQVEWQNMNEDRFEELLKKHGRAKLPPRVRVEVHREPGSGKHPGHETTDSRLNELYGALTERGLIGSPIASVEPGSTDLEVKIIVGDGWAKLDHERRQSGAEELWTLWSSIRIPSDPEQARIALYDGTGQQIGGSRWWNHAKIWVND